MSRIFFVDEGWTDYLYWQSADKKILRKINNLLKSIERDGVMSGEGKPEKLSYRINEYSRRIDKANRLVYEIINDTVVVKSCRGHYDD
ncbi:MAG: Txe/YoeB family addiction module toxin [Selenomonadaceae bacterium]|nr:Txe/YoeB family addiction module toxin [Selenomonadaceae bacterium]